MMTFDAMDFSECRSKELIKILLTINVENVFLHDIKTISPWYSCD